MGFLPVSVAATPAALHGAGEVSVAIASQYTDTTFEGMLTVDAPAGWRVEPESRPVALEPGGHTVFPLTVTPSDEAAARAGDVLRAGAVGGGGVGAVEDVVSVLIDAPEYAPPATSPETEIELGVQTQGTKNATARRHRAGDHVDHAGADPVAGSRATLRVGLANRTRGRIDGEAMPVSPWGTWDFIGPYACRVQHRAGRRNRGHLRRRDPRHRRTRPLVGPGEADVVRPCSVHGGGARGGAVTHAHSHTHTDIHDAATAAQAQREATVIGWVAGTPIPRERLDARVRELRAGRLAGRLPTVGSKEDRQFLRWTAQVLLTEELCRMELARVRGESGVAADEQPGSARATDASVPLAADLASARRLTQAESVTWAPSMLRHGRHPRQSQSLRSGHRAHRLCLPAFWHPHLVPRDLHRGRTVLEATTCLRSSLGVDHARRHSGTARRRVACRAAGDAGRPRAYRLAGTSRPSPPPKSVPPTRAADRHHRSVSPGRLQPLARPAPPSDRHAAPGFEHPGDPSQPDNTHRH